jgi:hypothetical protein
MDIFPSVYVSKYESEDGSLKYVYIELRRSSKFKRSLT